MIIAGTGSAKTPREILQIMTEIAERVKAQEGWVRTGHFRGADQAFQQGAGKSAVVYLPYENFNANIPMQTDKFMNLETVRQLDSEVHRFATHSVYKYHPAYKGLHAEAKRKLAISYLQILGLKGTPVDAVVCWTENYKNGRPKGVASQTVRIAEDYGIPIINLSGGYYFGLDTEGVWRALKDVCGDTEWSLMSSGKRSNKNTNTDASVVENQKVKISS